MSGVTPSSTVGPTKLPSGYWSGRAPRPSSGQLAPWSIPLPMSPSIRSLACGVMTGPTSASGSRPAESFSPWAFSAIRPMISRPASPTKTAEETAMHRWPAAPNAAPTSALAVVSGSASGITTAWFLAPMLDCTRLPFAVPRWYTWVPAASEPTKEMALMSGWSQIPFTTSCVPCTTLSTPFGMPASSASSASIMAVSGVRSEGFSTNVLPHVMATGYIHSGIMAGKLKGQMPPTTPRGSRTE